LKITDANQETCIKPRVIFLNLGVEFTRKYDLVFYPGLPLKDKKNWKTRLPRSLQLLPVTNQT
jgi:hypothetical protein